MLDELKNEDTIDVEETIAIEEKIEDEADSTEAAENTDVIVEAPKSEETQALAPVENGVLGSTKVTKTASKPKPKSDKAALDERVAIFSTKNVTWSEIGSKVYRGYNIVKPAIAEKWLTKDFIRAATPEEVAKEYGL